MSRHWRQLRSSVHGRRELNNFALFLSSFFLFSFRMIVKPSSWNRKAAAAELRRPLLSHSGWEAAAPERQQLNNHKRKSRTAIKWLPKWIKKSAIPASLLGKKTKNFAHHNFQLVSPPPPPYRPNCFFFLYKYSLVMRLLRLYSDEKKELKKLVLRDTFGTLAEEQSSSLTRMMTAVHPAPKSKQRYRWGILCGWQIIQTTTTTTKDERNSHFCFLNYGHSHQQYVANNIERENDLLLILPSARILKLT